MLLVHLVAVLMIKKIKSVFLELIQYLNFFNRKQELVCAPHVREDMELLIISIYHRVATFFLV